MKTILLSVMAVLGIGIGVNFFKKTPPPSMVSKNTEQNAENTPIVEKSTQKIPDLTIDELLGRFDPAQHKDFVRISPIYASRPNIFLRKDTYDAIKKMFAAATADGISLDIISGTRNFTHQKNIWEGKWNGDYAKYPAGQRRALEILKYSSMPGTSRHHWGTDVDFNKLTDKYFTNDPVGKQIYDWLQKNAHKFGFCQTYTTKGKNRPTGYEEEKWHWSYLPLSQNFTKQYREKVKYENINGFQGSETAASIGIIEKYVLGINADCQ